MTFETIIEAIGEACGMAFTPSWNHPRQWSDKYGRTVFRTGGDLPHLIRTSRWEICGLEPDAAYTRKEAIEALSVYARDMQAFKDTDRAHAGADWLFDAPAAAQCIWGRGSGVLHASGEALMIVGGDGVGKSTIAQQIVMRWIGADSAPLFGFHVEPAAGRVLYLAMDRPQQIRRSMLRMLRPEHRDLIGDKLAVWEGPLPFDLKADPGALLTFIRERFAGVSHVVVDSIKDAVPGGVSSDEGGDAWNKARQTVLAAGIELLELHHPRKAQQGNEKRKITIDDLYGSRWLAAGAGSIVYLGGLPGAESITLHHIKQPGEPVGPLDLVHDHETGRTAVVERVELMAALKAAGDGMTAVDAACLLYSTDEPSDYETKAARQRLQKLVDDGRATRQEGQRAGSRGSAPARFFAYTIPRRSTDTSPETAS